MEKIKVNDIKKGAKREKNCNDGFTYELKHRGYG